jgi:glycosyltransferase involved in cell wall biosynthesis
MKGSALLIAYMFPPRAAAGTYRLAQFAKYLPEFGWTPYILSASLHDYEERDATPLQDVELDDRVLRTSRLPIDALDRYVMKWAKRFLASSPSSASNEEESASSSASVPTWRTMLERAGFTLRDWLYFPDRFAGWIPFAIREGARFVRKHDIDVIFSTFKPASSHLVGWALSERLDCPWVADFRDPWAYNAYRNDEGSIRWRADRWLQEQVMSNADAVVTVSDRWRDMMCDQFGGEEVRSKYHTIMNAFDPEEYRDPPPPYRETFTLVYTGTIYGHRNPAALFEALRDLVEDGTIEPEHFQLVVAGRQGRSLRRMVARYGLEEIVDLPGYIPHRDAVSLQQKASALLLIEDSDPGCCPSKLFEYLGAKRPILAITPRGGVIEEVVDDTSSGTVVDPSDSSTLHNTLRVWYESFRRGESHAVNPDEEAIERYSRRNRTRELASLFETLATRSHERRQATQEPW